MAQNNLFMDDDDMRLYIDVQPLFIDELENSKNSAAASALRAAQSEEAAKGWKNDIEDYKTGLELFYARATDGITNSYNTSISGLSAAKNSAISDLTLQKNSIQTNLNNSLNSAIVSIRTNGQSYVNQAQYYAEEAQRTVDNRVSTDHLNQSKGLLTGFVSTDEEVFADVQKYAHSTFDRSKFTVVGSPTITDDGIASGFSSGNYVKCPFDVGAKTWKLKFIVNPSAIPLVNTGFLSINGPYSFGINIGTTNTFSIALSSNGTDVNIGYLTANTPLTLNTNNEVECGWNGTQYYVAINNGIPATIDSTTPIYNSNGVLNIGANRNASSFYSNGSFDLKQFSTTADGVEVFSGNKTGIDTIKPDDYTVVGTPTISADGIASGFSVDNNFVLKTLNLSNASSLKIEFANIYCPRQTTERHKAFFEIQPSSNSSYFGLRLFRNVAMDAGLGAVYPTSSGSATIVGLNPSFIAARNFSGYIEIKNNILSFVINDTACGSYELTTEQLAYIFTNVNLSIGVTTHSGSGQYLADGSIDLNAFKIYVDGNLVYQPCLKIPYTESKTGSKIVDSIYRDRVNDMAEQFGYANYYTLDEDNGNFTLPKGEVYGMIEKLRELIIQRTS